MTKYFLNVILFAAYALFSGGGLVLIKHSMEKSIVNFSSLLDSVLSKGFILGFILYILGFLSWLVILSKFKLNFAFPVAMSLFFLVSMGSSVLFLKESITTLHVIGIILCLLGIIIITSQ